MKKKANVILILVAVLWGGGFIATNGALDSFSPFYMMMIRFLGASIFPLIWCFKKLKSIDAYVLYRGILTGIFLFLAFAFQTFGLKYSSPSKNAFLTATNVIIVPYLLWLFMKRKPHKKEIIASLLCTSGIALLTLKPEGMILSTGDVLSLLCAVFFAMHIIALERYAKHCDAVLMTALQMFTAGILSTVCALLFEVAPMHIEVQAIGNILYLIFISTLLAYLLQTYAQKFTSANSASLILSTEALFASLFSFLLLAESMSLPMVIGAFLIFSSIIYIEYKPKQQSVTSEDTSDMSVVKKRDKKGGKKG